MSKKTEKTRSKILLVSNTAWYLFNFRRPLAHALRRQGLDVVMVCPKDAYFEKLQNMGFRCISYSLHRRSMNPLMEIFTLFHLMCIYKSEKPTAIHHFTVKCILYGTIAARMSGVKSVINAVTGLGHIFLASGWKMAIIRPFVKVIYRWVFKSPGVRVVFQNKDDLEAFQTLNLISRERSILIKSSGVDTHRFSPRVELGEFKRPIILFASRLLKEKGIFDFIEAARILKARRTNAIFRVAGSFDCGNPSSVNEKVIEQWKVEDQVEFMGHVEDMENLMADATVFVLPSYREGAPRVLLEASAMEKPVIATDVPGCREVVDNEKSGFLIPVRNPTALADAIAKLLGNSILRKNMGKAGRSKILLEFSDTDIADQTVKVYESMGVMGHGQDTKAMPKGLVEFEV